MKLQSVKAFQKELAHRATLKRNEAHCLNRRATVLHNLSTEKFKEWKRSDGVNLCEGRVYIIRQALIKGPERGMRGGLVVAEWTSNGWHVLDGNLMLLGTYGTIEVLI